eukprot:s14_g4.t1
MQLAAQAIHPAPAAVPRALPRPRALAEGKPLQHQFCAPAASVAVLAVATTRAARTSRAARGGEESGRKGFSEMVHWLKENGALGLENIERQRGASSPFAPLLATLPSARDLAAHPIFWPPGLFLRKILASCPHSCRMVYHMQLRASLEAAELVEHGAAASREEALWALALVESRAVTLTDEGPDSRNEISSCMEGESPPWRLGLCPIIDFLNHQEPSEGAAPRCKLVDDVAAGHVEVAAARTLEAGDELLFIYEECSSAQLFARYGFVQFPPAIPHPNERCLLNVPIADPSLPGGLEAAAARVAFVRQSGWRRSAWRPLLLRMPYNAEEGGSLMPLARLALLPSADAVWGQGASCWNGRLSDAAMEAQAEELARRWLTEAEAALTAARFHGFTAADMDKKFQVSLVGLSAEHTLKEILATLQSTYSGSVGIEYMHIGDLQKIDWIRQRVEDPNFIPSDKNKLLKVYKELLKVDTFEMFLNTQYKTTKRFGVDGGEAAVAGVNAAIEKAATLGMSECVIGMPHRGRLNVLTNVVRKPLVQMFAEFKGTHYDFEKLVEKIDEDDWLFAGDVKYHLGTSQVFSFEGGKTITATLEANPSHLETVNTVTLGRARAKQYYLGNTAESRTRVLPILFHGDAWP